MKKYKNILIGKFKSKLEYYIYKSLIKQLKKKISPIPHIEINKRGLIKDNKHYEIDLYIPLIQLGIEIQGPLHYSDINQIYRDFKKKELLQNIGIKLMYIDIKDKTYCLLNCINFIVNKILKIKINKHYKKCLR